MGNRRAAICRVLVRKDRIVTNFLGFTEALCLSISEPFLSAFDIAHSAKPSRLLANYQAITKNSIRSFF